MAPTRTLQEQLTVHDVNVFHFYYFYIALFLFVSLVAVWLARLTKALEFFDPIFIIPMLQVHPNDTVGE